MRGKVYPSSAGQTIIFSTGVSWKKKKNMVVLKKTA
jgi:hypothetical protein